MAKDQTMIPSTHKYGIPFPSRDRHNYNFCIRREGKQHLHVATESCLQISVSQKNSLYVCNILNDSRPARGSLYFSLCGCPPWLGPFWPQFPQSPLRFHCLWAHSLMTSIHSHPRNMKFAPATVDETPVPYTRRSEASQSTLRSTG